MFLRGDQHQQGRISGAAGGMRVFGENDERQGLDGCDGE